MDVRIEQGWREALKEEWDTEYFARLTAEVRERYKRTPNGNEVYPPAGQIFRAFDLCPFDRAKVVILGQDPYHGPGQANGLAFSVKEGIPQPPSLINIFKEIQEETGHRSIASADGDLSAWARQGVLLLNSSLTVDRGRPGSHKDIGWQIFTQAAINVLAEKKSGLVFMLWGAHAIAKGVGIDRAKHLVLTSPHPSPLSAHRGFMGNNHFNLANQYLAAAGKEPIKW